MNTVHAAENLENVIDRFLEAIASTKPLSPKTLSGYKIDLLGLARRLSRKGQDIMKATSADLERDKADRIEGGSKPTSISRMVTSCRRFYQHLFEQGVRSDNPAKGIVRPKIPRHPYGRMLSDTEVEQLLATPQRQELTPLDSRDVTMLKVIHATGIRISEITELSMGQVDLEKKVLKIVRNVKGYKMIELPLNGAAEPLRAFIDGPRKMLLGKRTSQCVFLTTRDGAMTRQTLWHIIRRRARKAGLSGEISPNWLRPRATA